MGRYYNAHGCLVEIFELLLEDKDSYPCNKIPRLLVIFPQTPLNKSLLNYALLKILQFNNI